MVRTLRLIALALTFAGPLPRQTSTRAAKAVEFRSFSLVHIAAADAARIVHDLVGLPRPARVAAGGSGPRLVVDRRTNSVMVLAPGNQMRLIGEVINAIDVAAAAASDDSSDEHPLARVELPGEGIAGSCALEMVGADEVLLSGSHDPGDDGGPSAQSARANVPSADLVSTAHPAEGRQQRTDSEIHASSRPEKPKSARPAESTVSLTTDGTRIILVSDDLQALDRMEDVVKMIIAITPQRTGWTVCYLRSADA